MADLNIDKPVSAGLGAETFQFTGAVRSTINSHLLTAAKIRGILNDKA
jgi:hypothetical protein